MKSTFTIIAVITFLTVGFVHADDTESPAKTTYDLELSRQLTLEPEGQAPVATVKPSSGVPGYISLLLIAAGLAGAWFAYRQGRRSEVRDNQHFDLKLEKNEEEILSLKNALMESGSGARSEWQGSLTTIQNDIEDKNRRIDGLLDKLNSSEQLGTELQDNLHSQETGFEETLKEREETFNAIIQEHEELQEQRATEYQQTIDALTSEHQATIESLTTTNSEHIQAHTDEHQQAAEQTEAKHTDELATLASEYQESLKTLSSTHEQEVTELKTAHDEALDTLRQQIQTTIEERDEHAQRLSALDENLQTTSQELDESRTQSSTLLQQIENLRLDFEKLQGTGAEDTQKISLLGDQNSSLEIRIATLEEDLESRNQELLAQSGNVDQLTSELESLRASKHDLDNIEKQRLQLQAQLDDTNEHVTALADEKSIMARELEDANKQLESLLAEKEAALEEADKLAEKTTVLDSTNATIEKDLHETQEKVVYQSELLNANDGRLRELIAESTKQVEQIRELREEKNQFTDTITNLEQKLSEAQQESLQAQTLVGGDLQQAQDDLNNKARKLESTAADRDSLSSQLRNVEAQLNEALEDTHQNELKSLRMSSELVEYKTRQEDYLQQIAAMEHELTELQANRSKINTQDTNEDLEGAIRARDNIVAVLEKDLQDAEAKIDALSLQIENLELAAVASNHDAVSIPVDGQENHPDVDALKQQLIEKIRGITLLEADLKVHKDLVKVFENDSHQLQKVETELEDASEANSFLQSELATAVNEVNKLKDQIRKYTETAKRNEDIGRTISKPMPHQELLFRLAALEAENKEQLALIKSLRVAQNEQDSDDGPQINA